MFLRQPKPLNNPRTEPISSQPETEQEGSYSQEYWLVDDDTVMATASIRLWNSDLNPGYSFRYFDTAEEALAELRTLAKNQQPTPRIIISDGNLANDEGELRDGAVFVAAIRQITGIRQPIIVAMSASDTKLMKMKGAGADRAYAKGHQMNEVVDLFKSID